MQKANEQVSQNKDLNSFARSLLRERDIAQRGMQNILLHRSMFKNDKNDEACPPPEITALAEHCKRMHSPIIIRCDANAHHVIWGSSKNLS